MTVDPKKPRPDYYDFTYDMFITSISGEESEISRFPKWIDGADIVIRASHEFGFAGKPAV
jgi:hypothetical protein